ncbi:hypothetical protein RGQ29_032161 [Quercus rubra]|uniref:Uncharacterized protein n=1 Tax=Quercus rubra TaxID=3512 RepID=A0AAN7I582_QUERU|nr:hypothetical protein RGQ29_032161 [Quercus rubra]
MYLVGGGGGGPLDIVLSGSGRLVHGPLDGRCKARNWNTLIPFIPVLRFRACPSVWSILHTASFLLPFLLTRRGPGPHKGGGSLLNISAIGGNFARIRSPILVHPG